MKTDTPRTDSIKEAYGNAPDPCAKGFMHSYANLARELERENAAIKRKLDDWHSATDSDLRLRMGELSAQDIRNIRAVLSAIHHVS